MFKRLFTGWGILATLIVVLGVAVNIGLGLWQWNRHQQRQALNERINAGIAAPPILLDQTTASAELDYRRVQLRGTFDASQEIVLRNRAYGDIPGVHVLTPLRLSGSQVAVLVDRGWLPMDEATPEKRRAYPPPSGELTLEGVALRSQADLPGVKDPPLRAGETRLDAWFKVDLNRIQQQVSYPLLPVFVVLQPEKPSTDLPIRQKTTDLGPGSHFGYSIQWFAFGAIMLGAYVAWTYQQVKQET
jgi:surfeit locus 1 family protein